MHNYSFLTSQPVVRLVSRNFSKFVLECCDACMYCIVCPTQFTAAGDFLYSTKPTGGLIGRREYLIRLLLNCFSIYGAVAYDQVILN